MEGKVMTQYEPHTAKKIYLYRNGTEKTNAKLIVINERQIRDFGTFLSRATSGIKAPVAVRNIYTPSGGHKIRSLEKLVNGRYYVAGGTEQFQKVKSVKILCACSLEPRPLLCCMFTELVD